MLSINTFMTEYFHPSDKNLSNLHKAMQYDPIGQPEVRVKARAGSDEPMHVIIDGAINGGAIAPTQSDAFGRVRVSNPTTLFDTQARYYDHLQFANARVGTSNVVYNANSSTFSMNVSSGSTDSVICETFKTFSYQPGKSLLVFNTFCMNESKDNLRQRVGYFGAQNGIYFENVSGTLNMVIRSFSSGSIVEDRVPQSSWNGDTLLGTGGDSNPSGITINPALTQIFWTDIEWLGVGSVRVGFVINGAFIVCHTFNHANTVSIPGVTDNTTTYMSTANLPIRYELTNTSATTSGSTLRMICSSVISEGGYSLSGTPRGIGHALATPVTLPSDQSFKPLISIRLKSTMLDAIVVPKFVTIAPTAQSLFKFRVYTRAITSGGSWNDAASDSPVQYNLAPTSLTSGTIVSEYFIVSSNQNSSSISQAPFGFELQLQRDPFTNTAYEYVITGATTGNGQTVFASIDWQEIS